jgi:hypothetical protein
MTDKPTEISTDIPPERKAATLIAGKMPNLSDAKDPAVEKKRLEELTYETLTDMEKTLLDGALQKQTAEDGARQVYHNMFHKTGWKYMAGSGKAEGIFYTRKNLKTGMCESYRNAFKEALLCYESLRKKTGSAAVKDAPLNILEGDDLRDLNFCTKQGLTLMGGLKGNVYCMVDGTGKLLEEGIGTINRFVFTGHWTLSVNGVFYDPIFESIGGKEDNVEWKLAPSPNRYLAPDGKNRFVPNKASIPPNGEFGANFIWVTGWGVFAATVKTMERLYTGHKDEIDEILVDGKKTSKWSKDQRQWHDWAQKIVQDSVSEVDTFLMVVTAGYNTDCVTRPQLASVTKILDLAAK